VTHNDLKPSNVMFKRDPDDEFKRFFAAVEGDGGNSRSKGRLVSSHAVLGNHALSCTQAEYYLCIL
jgi:hypothetical protein